MWRFCTPIRHKQASFKISNWLNIANKPGKKKNLHPYYSIVLKSTQTVPSMWEGRRVGWPLWCVSNISPKIPAGRIVLGVPWWTLVLLYLTGSQRRKQGEERRGKERERENYVMASWLQSIGPTWRKKHPLCVAWVKIHVALSLPLSLSFFSFLVGRRDVGNEA